jgi:ABC-type transporter Mla subunit MlaD
MKWEKADLAVGAVVLGAVAIAIGSTVWFAPAVRATSVTYYSTFDRIEGMTEQAEVRLRGFTVGRVAKIEPTRDAKRGLLFKVTMRIDAKLASGEQLAIPSGTKARLVPPPVIGTANIALEPPDSATAPLPDGSVLEGVRSQAVLDQVSKLTGDLNSDVRKVIVSTLALLDSLRHTAGTAHLAMESAVQLSKATSEELPLLFKSVQRDLATADTLLKGLQAVTPKTLKVADSVSLLLSDSRKAIAKLTGLAASREPELVRIVANLDTSAVLLRYFAQQVSKSPMRALTGVTPPPPRDVPPKDTTRSAVAPPKDTTRKAAPPTDTSRTASAAPPTDRDTTGVPPR